VVPTEAAADIQLIEALLAGEQAAFLDLVNRYQAAMLRIARIYVNDTHIAEEVVQDTWLAMLQGLDRFEGRSSIKTWLFTILTNKAKTRGQRESRSLPFSDLVDAELQADLPAVEPQRFFPEGHEWEGHWASRPLSWERANENYTLTQELLATIQSGMETLPENQRVVMTLRDVDGLTSSEVCNILQISETNQRVLLHRARSRIRQMLENYLHAET
jgi:RNA polymerase sigma-70 factor (ECF subfamily)